MKNLYLTLIMFSALLAEAQTYSFNYSMEMYEPLRDSISLNRGFVWDDPELEIPFGFNFKFAGQTIDKIYIEDYGMGAFLTPSLDEKGVLPLIFAYGADIIDKGYVKDHSESEISYKIVGASGSKICKIEWKNFGYYGELEANDTCIDFGNLQVWFYEGSNNIEMHFGPGNVALKTLNFDLLPGPFVGIAEKYDFTTGDGVGNMHFVIGDASKPSLAFADSFSFIDDYPPNGTVYKFEIKTAGTKDVQLNTFYLSPNPARNHLMINGKGQIDQIAFYTLQGKLVKTSNEVSNIDVSLLSRGVYIVEIKSGSELTKQRLVLH